jgi:hypothetical protein
VEDDRAQGRVHRADHARPDSTCERSRTSATASSPRRRPKALASGNPHLLEKAEVDANLQKLTRLERAHTQRERDLQSRITTSTAAAAGYAQALKDYDAALPKRRDVSGDNFTIHVAGTDHAKRSEGGDALRNELGKLLMQHHYGDGKPAKVGEYGGFNVIGRARQEQGKGKYIEMSIEGVPNTTSSFDSEDLAGKAAGLGLLSRLDNRLADMPERREDAARRLERLKTDIAKSQAGLGQEFPERDRLDAARSRSTLLNEMLTADSGNENGVSEEQAQRIADLRQKLATARAHDEALTAAAKAKPAKVEKPAEPEAPAKPVVTVDELARDREFLDSVKKPVEPAMPTPEREVIDRLPTPAEAEHEDTAAAEQTDLLATSVPDAPREKPVNDVSEPRAPRDSVTTPREPAAGGSDSTPTAPRDTVTAPSEKPARTVRAKDKAPVGDNGDGDDGGDDEETPLPETPSGPDTHIDVPADYRPGARPIKGGPGGGSVWPGHYVSIIGADGHEHHGKYVELDHLNAKGKKAKWDEEAPLVRLTLDNDKTGRSTLIVSRGASALAYPMRPDNNVRDTLLDRIAAKSDETINKDLAMWREDLQAARHLDAPESVITGLQRVIGLHEADLERREAGLPAPTRAERLKQDAQKPTRTVRAKDETPSLLDEPAAAEPKPETPDEAPIVDAPKLNGQLDGQQMIGGVDPELNMILDEEPTKPEKPREAEGQTDVFGQVADAENETAAGGAGDGGDATPPAPAATPGPEPEPTPETPAVPTAEAPAKPKRTVTAKPRKGDEVTFHEQYGNVSRAQLAAYKKHNVSPSDHDDLVETFGEDDHAGITAAVKDPANQSESGLFSSFQMHKNQADRPAETPEAPAAPETPAAPAEWDWSKGPRFVVRYNDTHHYNGVWDKAKNDWAETDTAGGSKQAVKHVADQLNAEAGQPSGPVSKWAPTVSDRGPDHRQILDPATGRVLFDIEKDENGVWGLKDGARSGAPIRSFPTWGAARAWSLKHAHLQRDGKELPDEEGNHFEEPAKPEAPYAPDRSTRPRFNEPLQPAGREVGESEQATDAPPIADKEGRRLWLLWNTRVSDPLQDNGTNERVLELIANSDLPLHDGMRGLKIEVTRHNLQEGHAGEYDKATNTIRLKPVTIEHPQGLFHELGHLDSAWRGTEHSEYADEHMGAEERYAEDFARRHNALVRDNDPRGWKPYAEREAEDARAGKFDPKDGSDAAAGRATDEAVAEPDAPAVPDAADDATPEVPAEAPKQESPRVALEGEKFPPTEQQQAVIDPVLDGKDVIVQAKAGAGKTSTLEMIARRLGLKRPNDKIAYLAFNKSVQTEAEGRMPSNVEPRTGHSVAFAWAEKWIQERTKDQSALRRPDAIARHIGINEPMNMPDGAPLSPSERAMAAVRTVDAYANSADDEVSAKHLPERFHELGAAEQKALVADARKVWADLQAKDGRVRLSLDHVRKMWALSRPDFSKPGSGLKRPAHVLFLDEAQDTPPVLAKVVADQHIQKVIVGDADQAIYGFTGATDFLSTAKGDVEKPLTKSWRFGPQVADLGNRFLQLLGSKDRVEGGGKPSHIHPAGTMEGADAILVRSNGGMISEIMREQAAGRRVGVPKGTKTDLTSLVDSARYLSGQGPAPARMHDDLAPYRTWDEVKAEAQKGDDPKIAMLARIVDQNGVDGLDQIIQNVIEPGEGLSGVRFDDMPHGLVARGKTFGAKDHLKAAGFLFREIPGEKDAKGQPAKAWTAFGTPEQREATLAKAREAGQGPAPDVTVSTAHKAKGLEWGRVRIGDDFRGPKVDEESGKVKEMPSPEELRLAYVAVTRAEKELDPGSLAWVLEHTDHNGGTPGVTELPADEVAKDRADLGIPEPKAPSDAVSAPKPAAVEPKAPEAEAAPDAGEEWDPADGIKPSNEQEMAHWLWRKRGQAARKRAKAPDVHAEVGGRIDGTDQEKRNAGHEHQMMRPLAQFDAQVKWSLDRETDPATRDLLERHAAALREDLARNGQSAGDDFQARLDAAGDDKESLSGAYYGRKGKGSKNAATQHGIQGDSTWNAAADDLVQDHIEAAVDDAVKAGIDGGKVREFMEDAAGWEGDMVLRGPRAKELMPMWWNAFRPASAAGADAFYDMLNRLGDTEGLVKRRETMRDKLRAAENVTSGRTIADLPESGITAADLDGVDLDTARYDDIAGLVSRVAPNDLDAVSTVFDALERADTRENGAKAPQATDGPLDGIGFDTASYADLSELLTEHGSDLDGEQLGRLMDAMEAAEEREKPAPSPVVADLPEHITGVDLADVDLSSPEVSDNDLRDVLDRTVDQDAAGKVADELDARDPLAERVDSLPDEPTTPEEHAAEEANTADIIDELAGAGWGIDHDNPDRAQHRKPKGSWRDQARDAWEDYRQAYFTQVEGNDLIRGHYMTQEGFAKGISKERLFGNRQLLNKYASPELLEYMAANPFLTLTEYQRQWAEGHRAPDDDVPSLPDAPDLDVPEVPEGPDAGLSEREILQRDLPDITGDVVPDLSDEDLAKYLTAWPNRGIFRMEQRRRQHERDKAERDGTPTEAAAEPLTPEEVAQTQAEIDRNLADAGAPAVEPTPAPEPEPAAPEAPAEPEATPELPEVEAPSAPAAGPDTATPAAAPAAAPEPKPAPSLPTQRIAKVDASTLRKGDVIHGKFSPTNERGSMVVEHVIDTGNHWGVYGHDKDGRMVRILVPKTDQQGRPHGLADVTRHAPDGSAYAFTRDMPDHEFDRDGWLLPRHMRPGDQITTRITGPSGAKQRRTVSVIDWPTRHGGTHDRVKVRDADGNEHEVLLDHRRPVQVHKRGAKPGEPTHGVNENGEPLDEHGKPLPEGVEIPTGPQGVDGRPIDVPEKPGDGDGADGPGGRRPRGGSNDDGGRERRGRGLFNLPNMPGNMPNGVPGGGGMPGGGMPHLPHLPSWLKLTEPKGAKGKKGRKKKGRKGRAVHAKHPHTAHPTHHTPAGAGQQHAGGASTPHAGLHAAAGHTSPEQVGHDLSGLQNAAQAVQDIVSAVRANPAGDHSVAQGGILARIARALGALLARLRNMVAGQRWRGMDPQTVAAQVEQALAEVRALNGQDLSGLPGRDGGKVRAGLAQLVSRVESAAPKMRATANYLQPGGAPGSSTARAVDGADGGPGSAAAVAGRDGARAAAAGASAVSPSGRAVRARDAAGRGSRRTGAGRVRYGPVRAGWGPHRGFRGHGQRGRRGRHVGGCAWRRVPGGRGRGCGCGRRP